MFIHALQCTSDDHVAALRCIVCQWIDSLDIDDIRYRDIEHIPFSGRYFQMARANRHYALDSEMAAALRPETDYDRHELSQWLNDLLCRMHREVC